MAGEVYIRKFAPPPWNEREIARYACAGESAKEVADLLESCRAELGDKLTYQVCHARFPVRRDGEWLDLGFARVRSEDLRRNLENCGEVVVFAATVGLEIDRLVARHGRLSPARALMFQAMGAERIEALSEAFCDELSEESCKQGKAIRPRFSPGYGDLPLELQRDIFRVLDCPRRIGLTLNHSLLMSPTKSVTALVGVGDEGECGQRTGCMACRKVDCHYRREL